MAPQMGPKDAATMLKNPIRLSATPVMARTALNVTPPASIPDGKSWATWC